MKRIRLTDDDYILIFPYAKPIEIRREFGEHSHCIAQIRNKYKKLNYESQFKALRAYKEAARKLKPIDVDWYAWDRKIDSDIAERRRTAFETVRSKLNDRIALHKNEVRDVI